MIFLLHCPSLVNWAKYWGGCLMYPSEGDCIGRRCSRTS